MTRTRRKIQNDSLVQDIAGIACIAFGGILFVGIVAPRAACSVEHLAWEHG